MSFGALGRTYWDRTRATRRSSRAHLLPIVATPDLDRLQAFYQRLFGAVETTRHPTGGPVFFVGLRLGDSELGLVNEADGNMANLTRALPR